MGFDTLISLEKSLIWESEWYLSECGKSELMKLGDPVAQTRGAQRVCRNLLLQRQNGIVLWPEISCSQDLASFSFVLTGWQWINSGHSCSQVSFPLLHAAHLLSIQDRAQRSWLSFTFFSNNITALLFPWDYIFYSQMQCGCSPCFYTSYIQSFPKFF